ncbi:MAG: nickel-dependent hydrogenase large subunit, partial [Nitrospinae bacterium]|nr:nickel-dependent hydrogenase large subunit [Nitrospinota bacterium]
GRIFEAKASGVMFRGFEYILKGHFPEDALVYTPRICGICSISHSVASSNALAAISEDFTPSRSGQYAKNISHATENSMSHITQFYLYFAPDLLNKKYAGLEYYPALEKRLAGLKGESVKTIISERKRFLEILGLICGKWPHTLAIQPGGITKALTTSDILRIKSVLKHFTAVMETVLLGMPVKDYLKIKSINDFDSAFMEDSINRSDLALFYFFAKEAGFLGMGKGPGKFIAACAYPLTEGQLFMPAGYRDNGVSPLDAGKITESIKYSFFDSENPVSAPERDASEPKWGKPKAYSWGKAPRYNGEVVEVGALGRQLICGDNLITELFSKHGSTVFTRVFARLHEAVKLLDIMDKWADELSPDENYYAKNTLKQNAEGIGLTEAARGMLGHWISVENRKIKNYQVITPTGWNASPLDERETPGALEKSLLGLPVEDESNPVEIEHVIRSYDPCLVCAVH